MKKRNTLLAVILLSLAMAGCSTAVDEEPGGPKAAEFSASLAAVDTRADGEWSHFQKIGITALGDVGYRNQPYTTTATTGTAAFAPSTGVSAYYFQDVKDSETFVAYAPYSASVNTTDNTLAVATGDDYIWAEAKEMSYANSSAKLSFVHCMTQLNITLKLDEASLGAGATSTQEISNFIPAGTLSLADGKVTPGSDSEAFAFTSGETYVIVPQPEGAKVTVTVGGNSYQTVLPALEAGKSYQYTLTVKNEGLSVNPTISEWETEETALTAQKVSSTTTGSIIEDVSEVQVYDLAFSDGTFMRVADADGNLPSSITVPEDKTVCGIVFYTGGYPVAGGYTHGLIVALKEVTEEFLCPWQQLVSMDEVSDDPFSYLLSSDTQMFNGLENTMNIETYNIHCMESSNLEAKIVVPVQLRMNFIESYPNNCSSWFLPSNAELLCLSSLAEKLNTILSWVSGTTLSSSYWSSTVEGDVRAYAVNMDSSYSDPKYRTDYCKARYICAY